QRLHQQIQDALQSAHGPQTESSEWRWYQEQIDLVLRAFGHAGGRNECIISALEASEYHGGRPSFLAPDGADDEDSGPGWTFVGSAVGVGIIGALGLCYWRYRRLNRRKAAPH